MNSKSAQLLPNELIISINNLHFVSVSCHKCNTTITLDLNSDWYKSEPYNKPEPRLDRCVTCGYIFGDVVAESFARLKAAYRELLTSSAVSIQFRVKGFSEPTLVSEL